MKGIPFLSAMIRAIRNTTFDRYPPFPIDVTGPFKGVTRRNHEDVQYNVGQVYVAKEALIRVKHSAAYESDQDLVRGLDDRPIAWKWQRDRLPSIFMPGIADREWVRIIKVAKSTLGDMKPMDLVYEGLLVTNETMDRLYPDGWGAVEEEDEYRCQWVKLWKALHGEYHPGCPVMEYHFRRVREPGS